MKESITKSTSTTRSLLLLGYYLANGSTHWLFSHELDSINEAEKVIELLVSDMGMSYPEAVQEYFKNFSH